MNPAVESIRVVPWPDLELLALEATLPAPQGPGPSPDWLSGLLAPGAVGVPLRSSDAVRTAIRDLLRLRGYRPTGRGKPSSEYLANAAAEGRVCPILPCVDAGNAVSLHSGLPISIVDLDRCALPLAIDSPPAGTSYVFNRGGQEIDVSHLLCLHDAAGPCANAVKDAQRTKTSEQTRRVLAVLWGSSRCGTGHVAAAGRWLAQLMERLGARVQMVKCGQD